MRPTRRFVVLVGVIVGCASKSPSADSGDGAVSDASTTDVVDVALEGPIEAPPDVAVEAHVDAGTDASADVAPGTCVAPTSRGTCTPPANIYCPAPTLALTGCMDATNPTRLASNVIPYEVNSPLWSDSAYKARGFVLPAGGKIHVKDCAATPSECRRGPADTGKWVFPVGTVMVKSFMFDGKLVETRLLAHPDAFNWYGYTYQWNEAQTEATIVPDARVEVMFDTAADAGVVDWHYPSRTDCGDCHTQQAGGTLGPQTNQMNRVVGGSNQIAQFEAMDLFDAAVPKPYAAALVTPYAGQLGAPPADATLDDRARSYLHANCAHCHRPDADFNSFDLRYGVSLKDTMTCNAPLTMGDVGVPDAVVLAPGTPTKSSIWLRMNAPIGAYDNLHMPRIATFQFDTQGLQLVSDWITSIKTCP
ncbi:MAG TPA: hypothetical protein VHJ20_11160 [Polyangia bacterium]|nr:hypothetical protein [Polyangia bacterium]